MKDDVTLTTIGTATPTASVIISLLPEIEAWLRVTSLVIGIAVGIASLWFIIKKNRMP